MDAPRAHAIVPPVPRAPADADETDALRCLAEARPGDPVLVLGPSPAVDWARALGLKPTHRLTPATRWHARAAAARARRALRRQGVDSWRVWGAAARLLGTPDAAKTPPRPNGPEEPVGTQRPHDEPGREPDPQPGPDVLPELAPELAPELGLLPGEVAIAPVVGRPRAIDAQRALYLLGALELMGRRVALVLPEGAARLDQARAFAAATGLATRVLVHRLPLAVAARAIDLALIDADAPPDARPDALLIRAVEAAGARTVTVARGEQARPGLVDAAHAVGPIDRAIAALHADRDAAAAHNPA